MASEHTNEIGVPLRLRKIAVNLFDGIECVSKQIQYPPADQIALVTRHHVSERNV